MYVYDFLPLPDPGAGHSNIVCDVEHSLVLSILISVAASLFSAGLVSTVIYRTARYAIVSSTQEW